MGDNEWFENEAFYSRREKPWFDDRLEPRYGIRLRSPGHITDQKYAVHHIVRATTCVISDAVFPDPSMARTIPSSPMPCGSRILEDCTLSWKLGRFSGHWTNRTRSWTNVVFYESTGVHWVQFSNDIRTRVNWNVQREHVQGSLLKPRAKVVRYVAQNSQGL